MANLELARAKTVETVDEDVRRALQTHDGELGKSEIVWAGKSEKQERMRLDSVAFIRSCPERLAERTRG